MTPVRLSDDELNAVFDAARPLPVESRDGFLKQVASALQACPEMGPGAVYRVISEVQRVHWDPPDLGRGGIGKFGR